MYEYGSLDWTVVGASEGASVVSACLAVSSSGDNVSPSLDGTVSPTLFCPQDDRGGSVEILFKSACIWSKSGKCQYSRFFSITVWLRDGGKVRPREGWDGRSNARCVGVDGALHIEGTRDKCREDAVMNSPRIVLFVARLSPGPWEKWVPCEEAPYWFISASRIVNPRRLWEEKTH
jgi:hypothetical protein